MTKENIGAVGGSSWTASDTALIGRAARGFQVGVAGDVALGYPDGTTQVWPACAAGVLHPHNGFIRVLSTGTTATSIVVAY
tara:strand:+ start:508 stop:750 length:243 start_codon:yes stop_codon:yes gene_type:complete